MCEHKDPWVSGRHCMRVLYKHPYGAPDLKSGCPCERNRIIEKVACGLIAFRDRLTDSGAFIKKTTLKLTLNLKSQGFYTPIRLTLYPFNLHITLFTFHYIEIKIGKLCRLARFRFKIIDWSKVLEVMR